MANGLGEAVRRHRLERGMTGTELASSVGVRQGTISKIECGRLVPDLDFLARFVHAMRLTRGEADELMRLAGVVPSGVTPESVLQYLPVDFLTTDWSEQRQETVAAAESAAKSFSVFHPFLVPGLLQTTNYARHVLRAAGVPAGQSMERALKARLKRQRVLGNPRKRMWFVTTPAAVLSRVVPPSVLAEQVQHLLRLCRLPGLKLGLIPDGATLPVLPPPAFYVFEHKVYLELPHGDLWLMERSQTLEVYRDLFRRLSEVAVFGPACTDLLRRLGGTS